MQRFLYIVAILAIPATLCSCLRYTPSRASLASSEDGAKAQYEGEEAFFLLEKRQKDRLRDLVKSRAGSIKPGQEASYRVGVGDVLELFVFETDELNRKVRVRPDGVISLPLLGQMKVVGLTEQEIQRDITDKLDEFMHSPQVQVFIDQYAAHKVWVVGEIHKPGAYPLSRDNYSLIELLSEAGGRNERASSTIILIPEHTKTAVVESAPIESAPIESAPIDEQVVANMNNAGNASSAVTTSTATLASPTEASNARLLEENDSNLEPVTAPAPVELPNPVNISARRNGIEISFDDLVGSMDNSPLTVPLRAGDTIVVPEAGKVQVYGEVRTPGSFALPSKMTLMGAVAAAGGLNYAADVSEVEVIRELGNGQKALITTDIEKIALQEGTDIRLRDGDLVRVPSASGRFAINQVVNIVNSLLGRALAPIQTAAP